MKKYLFGFLFIITLLFISCTEQIDPNTPTTGVVNLFQINDTHGASLTDDSVTGMEYVQSVLESIESTQGEFIKICNGDAFQGGYVSNTTRGEIFIDIFNQMNFDCFVIGNHEFDWGLEEVAKYKDGDPSNGEANFPFLGANIVDKTTKERPDWIDEYAVFENNGYKVGIIGLIGENLETSISSDKMTNYEFAPVLPIIQRVSKVLHNDEKCDVVVVSIHEYSSSTNDKIKTLTGNEQIDAIICGHTHESVEEYVKRLDGYQIPVVQSYTKNGNVGTIQIRMNAKRNAQSALIKHYSPNNYPKSEKFEDIYDKYYDYFYDAKAPIGETKNFLSKESLGVIATNAMCDYFKADFGVVNSGGVRASIPKGKIYASDVSEVFPFDNVIYIIKISGKKLKQFYDGNASALYFNSNFDAKKLNDSTIYELAIIDFLYTNTRYGSLFANLEVEKTDVILRDLVTNYFRKNS